MIQLFKLTLCAVLLAFIGLAANQTPVVSQNVLFHPRAHASVAPVRHFWPTTVETLAAGRSLHTHVAVTGRVAPNYPRLESDGDLHIKLLSDSSSAFVIAECIPELPCRKPAAGQQITVTGISRRDPEHSWWEVHPVEGWR